MAQSKDVTAGQDGPAQVQGGRGRQQAEWRPLIGPELSRHCALIGCDHGVATPALLCHKDTVQDTHISTLSLCLNVFMVAPLHGKDPYIYYSRRRHRNM